MSTSTTRQSVSRRTALAGLGAGGLGLALAAAAHPAAAQDAATDPSKHPIVGTWLNGRDPANLWVTHWAPDGNMTVSADIVATGPDGAKTYNDIHMGTWEPVSERGIHFTFTFTSHDETGAATGTTTVDGYPVASEDGASFWDDGTKVTVTIRDTTGAVTNVLGPGMEGAGLGGVRMRPGKPGYDEMLALLAARTAATPTA